MPEKPCRKCWESKEVCSFNFYPSEASGGDGFKNVCRVCEIERGKARYRRTKAEGKKPVPRAPQVKTVPPTRIKIEVIRGSMDEVLAGVE